MENEEEILGDKIRADISTTLMNCAYDNGSGGNGRPVRILFHPFYLIIMRCEPSTRKRPKTRDERKTETFDKQHKNCKQH